ncbi:hypothetical protein SeMB42_g06436 [Synchytrium endobioticum]|uniref:Uncharacterized protein n=1 Tax=Synchytrium endobioticum TaxID=286115 RepID=A0A507CLR2_9FUNG|nr:hypothetical protein SeMB42_g06436 [Synchytrium endobioticum]TPX39928.1 hypothetical protein SeLEV6574_g06918 [Synchytrium endobioticum]
MGNYYLNPDGHPSTLSPKATALLKALLSQSPQALHETLDALFRRFTPSGRSDALHLLLISDPSVNPQAILNDMGALSDAAIEAGLSSLRYRTISAPYLRPSTVAHLADRVQADIYRDLIHEMTSVGHNHQPTDLIVYTTSPSPTLTLSPILSTFRQSSSS